MRDGKFLPDLSRSGMLRHELDACRVFPGAAASDPYEAFRGGITHFESVGPEPSVGPGDVSIGLEPSDPSGECDEPGLDKRSRAETEEELAVRDRGPDPEISAGSLGGSSSTSSSSSEESASDSEDQEIEMGAEPGLGLSPLVWKAGCDVYQHVKNQTLHLRAHGSD